MTNAEDGNITYVNNAFTLLTGYGAIDLIGKSPKVLQGEGTENRMISKLAEASKSGMDGDFDGSQNFKKDGAPITMYWRVVPVKVGGVIKSWVAVQREGKQIGGDTTSAPKLSLAGMSNRILEDDNEVSVDFLKECEKSSDSILMTDAEDGNITYVNNAFTLLTGYGAIDVIGKSPKFLQGEGTENKVISKLAEASKSGRDGDFDGSQNFKKDGTPTILYWRVVPVKVGGVIKSWMAIQREVSHN